MDKILISIISIALFGIATIMSLMINRRDKKEHETNYYFMFVVGCVFLTIGLTRDIQGFTIIGFILTLTGFFNKEKWISKEKDKLSKRDRVLKIAIITTTAIALVIGTVIFLLSR